MVDVRKKSCEIIKENITNKRTKKIMRILKDERKKDRGQKEDKKKLLLY